MLQLHWGFGNMGWPAMGVQIASFVDGKFGTEDNPRLPTDFEFNDLFSNLTNIAMDNFLPLPVSRSKILDDPLFYFLDSSLPSVFRPFLEYTANKNTFGYEITRQRASVVGGAYGGTMNTEELYRNLTEFVNQNTRFNKEGSWNMDPSVLSYGANAFIDGFARIISVLASSREISNLDDAKNKTLVFKQFFTKRVPIERDRYASMTKKLKKIEATNRIFEMDRQFVDSKGRTYEDFKIQNNTNLQSIELMKETEKELRKLYEEQKIYNLGFRDDGTKMTEDERLDEIQNIRIKIIAAQRELTNKLELKDQEENPNPLFK